MKKFEYYSCSNASDLSINKLGLEGWELVSVVNTYSNSNSYENQTLKVFYFKREIIE